MKSNFGQGIALSSDFKAADALWERNQARQAAGLAAQQKADSLQRQKAADYITKYINTANSGLHPIYQGAAQKQTSEYLTGLYEGLQRDPNYTQSQKNIENFQKLNSNLDKWGQSTTNIGKTANMLSEHPNDLEMSPDIKSALEKGDYEGFVKLTGGNDYYNPMQGIKGITNMVEANKIAQTDIYKDYTQGKPVKQGGFITIDDEYQPDLIKHKANALLYYKSHPFSAKEWESKGGFDAFYNALDKPTVFKKPRYAAQESKAWGGNYNYNGGGNSISNDMYEASMLNDGKNGRPTIYQVYSKDKTKTISLPILNHSSIVSVDHNTGDITPLTLPGGNKNIENVQLNYWVQGNDGKWYQEFTADVPEMKAQNYPEGVVMEATGKKVSQTFAIPFDEEGKGIGNSLTSTKKGGAIFPPGVKFSSNKAINKGNAGVAAAVAPKAGTPKKAATQRFVVNGVAYNIPNEEVAAFKKEMKIK